MSFGSPYFTLPEFQYLKPNTLQEALELIAKYGEDAKVMAGGVGLIAFMKERLLRPKYVVDIKGIKELRILRYGEGEGLTVGAAVTFNEILDYAPVKARYPALHEAIRSLSDAVLRNRSTLLGNLCEAMPFVDSPPPLMVYEGEVIARSVEGERTIPVTEFIKGLAETALSPSEIAVAVRLPDPPRNSTSRFMKHVAASEFSIVSVAALAANPHSPSKRIVRLAYGAATPAPVRAYEAEKVFSKEGPINALMREAVSLALKTISPMADSLATAEYRLHLIEVLTWRILKEVLRGVTGA